MTLLILITTVIVAILVILGGATVFTNGVEWLGKRLGLSDSVVGSVLAGVGTALPRPSFPSLQFSSAKGPTARRSASAPFSARRSC